MFRWLYNHVFRGIGIVFLAGMITGLILAVMQVTQHPDKSAPSAHVGR